MNYSRQILHVMPMGWGYSSLHTIGYFPYRSMSAVLTDGGTSPVCFSETVKKQCILSKLIDTFKKSELIAWIISHFDYDHISLMPFALKKAGTLSDICIIPFTYSIETCREASAMYMALIAYTVRKPTFPEILKGILKGCKRIFLAKQNSRLYVNSDTYYEFIWPDSRYISSYSCNRIQENIKKKLENYCKRNPRACAEIKELFEEIRKKLENISRGEILDELNIETLVKREKIERLDETRIEKREYIQEKSNEYYTLSENRLFSETINRHGLVTLKRDLENMFSLAYILKYRKPWHIYLETVIFRRRQLDCIYYDYNTFKSSGNLVLFLGDLDDLAINIALDNRTPTQTDILIPAHHGNSWNTKLQDVDAKIVYFNRCHKHPPHKYRAKLRTEYLKNAEVTIISGHECDLYVYL